MNIIICLLLISSTLILGQICTSFTNCYDCTAFFSDCSWCNSRKSCNYQSPPMPCTGGTVNSTGECPCSDTGRASDCYNCVQEGFFNLPPVQCEWCEGPKTCAPLSSNNCSNPIFFGSNVCPDSPFAWWIILIIVIVAIVIIAVPVIFLVTCCCIVGVGVAVVASEASQPIHHHHAEKAPLIQPTYRPT